MNLDPPSIKYLVGDVRKVLAKIPDNSIHLAVTSPPYYNLRVYKNPTTIWDGYPTCDHQWGDEIKVNRKASDNMGLDGHDTTHTVCAYLYRDTDRRGSSAGRFCKKCHAWEGCLGNEPTIELYIKHLVDVFRDVKRVLRSDGTFYLNIGDNYSDSNLVGMPFLVADAMKKDGWIWRSCIPWIKTSGMPDSTPNRPGVSIEYIHQFVKSNEPQYWMHRDLNGVRVKPEPDYRYIDLKTKTEYANSPPGFDPNDKEHWKRINLWDGQNYYYDQYAVLLKGKVPAGTLAAKGSAERKAEPGVNARPAEYIEYTGMRNRRNIDWFIDSLRSFVDGEQGLILNTNGDPLALKVNPVGFPDFHYAVFPVKLIDPLILSGTSEYGCCPDCGAPWSRVLEKERIQTTPEEYDGKINEAGEQAASRRVLLSMKSHRDAGLPHDNPFLTPKSIEWRPTCSCPSHEPIRCSVLDPFVGSGTTMVVAYQHGRNSIGIDISKEYAEITMRRFKTRPGYQHSTEEFA